MNEEDIKNLSEIIELCEAEINNNDENVTAILDLTDLKSLRNLINRNKELEEENEIYKEELEKIDKVLNLEAGRAAPYRYEIIESLQRGIIQLKKIIDNSIPVSLVEEKIEELNKEERGLQDSISEEEREEYSDANISWLLCDIEIRRKCYKELLKNRRDKNDRL